MTPKKKTPTVGERAETINEHLGRRVKKLRGDRGWSLDNLAQASGVSRSMLSEIEREKANPTLAVTYRISSAFGMGIAELIETSERQAAIQVVRASDRGQFYRSDKNVQIRTLSPLNLEKDVEFYEVTVRVGGELRSTPHYEGTREFLTVEKGHIRLESSDDSTELGPADSATYRADVPHAIINVGSEDAVLFLVDIYR
jgi:transcriptional regulator with XRE-family HTH domain